MDGLNYKLQLAGLFVVIPVLISLYRNSTAVSEDDDEDSGPPPDFQVVEDRTPTGQLEHKHQLPGADQWNNLGLERPMVIAMVGLPARGKSYLVKMIQRYLNWTGYECEVFNVGKYRRELGMAGAAANFFSSANKDAGRVREEMAMAVLDSMYKWLRSDAQGSTTVPSIAGRSFALMEKKKVAIFDATNTTRKRRIKLIQRAKKENVSLLFVESICDDEEILKRNYLLKLKNDDYKGMDPAAALDDFTARVQQYEKVYETVSDDENNGAISYIKLINVGQKLITRNCSGFMASQIAFHLQNVHIQPRRIYLTLTAESSKHGRAATSVQFFDSTVEDLENGHNRELTGTGVGSLRSYQRDRGYSDGLSHPGWKSQSNEELEQFNIAVVKELSKSSSNADLSRNSTRDDSSPRNKARSHSNPPVRTASGRFVEVSGDDYDPYEIFDHEEVNSVKSEDTHPHTPTAYAYNNSLLSDKGYQYTIDLTRYVKLEQDMESGLGSIEHYEDGCGRDVLILAGTSDVHYETIAHLRMHYPYFHTPLLEELRGGDFHGLSNADIRDRYPEEYAKRMANKLTYRYPGVGGESYLDVIERVKPIIIELERQRRSVVVVCHLAVFRCIHAYFMGTPVNQLPYAEFKKNTVYVLSPGPMGCSCTPVDPSSET